MVNVKLNTYPAVYNIIADAWGGVGFFCLFKKKKLVCVGDVSVDIEPEENEELLEDRMEE